MQRENGWLLTCGGNSAGTGYENSIEFMHWRLACQIHIFVDGRHSSGSLSIHNFALDVQKLFIGNKLLTIKFGFVWYSILLYLSTNSQAKLDNLE
jgi:hypothetical protein